MNEMGGKNMKKQNSALHISAEHSEASKGEPLAAHALSNANKGEHMCMVP